MRWKHQYGQPVWCLKVWHSISVENAVRNHRMDADPKSLSGGQKVTDTGADSCRVGVETLGRILTYRRAVTMLGPGEGPRQRRAHPRRPAFSEQSTEAGNFWYRHSRLSICVATV